MLPIIILKFEINKFLHVAPLRLYLSLTDVVIVSTNFMCRGVPLSIRVPVFITVCWPATGAANVECKVKPSAQSAAHNIMVEQVWAISQDSNKVPCCHSQPV